MIHSMFALNTGEILFLLTMLSLGISSEASSFKFSAKDLIPPVSNIPLVVHGQDVTDAEKWPWQVFIELNNGEDQCGGSLISDSWILTAAHCFAGHLYPTNVTMGSKSKTGKGLHTVFGNVSLICCHPKYDDETLDNDICLVKLQTPQNPTVTIKPATLAKSSSTLEDGMDCIVTGWGYNEDYKLLDILQEATVKIVDREKCVSWHKIKETTVVNNTICAGHEKGGADSCIGDSGGPLVCKDKNNNYLLEGITSYGPEYCGSAKAPGIYTNVSHFLDWIEETMEDPCPKYAWDEWSQFTTCEIIPTSPSCIGRRTKTRKCFNRAVPVQVENSECYGPNQISMRCIHPMCLGRPMPQADRQGPF